jgi:uncharacterized protein with beta-barrel porin domain
MHNMYNTLQQLRDVLHVRLKTLVLFILCMLFTQCCLATDYVFPGNAVAPLTLQNNDTLTVNSGVFNAGPTFTVSNSATTSGQSVTIASGATLSSNNYAIYGPADGPFTIINNGILSGNVAAVQASGAHFTLTQNSATIIIGLIALGDYATVNFNSSAGSNSSLTTGINSTINFNSTGSPNSGIVGAAGTTVNVNNTITLAPISNVDSININSGTATMGNITGLGAALNVKSGTTLALGNNTIAGAGTITQEGTFTSSSTSALTSHTGIFSSSGTTTIAGQTLNNDFRVTAGTTSVTGVGTLAVNNSLKISGGALNVTQNTFKINSNATVHQTGGTLDVGATAGNFLLDTSATYIIDAGTFTRGSAGSSTWSNNSTFQVNGGTVNWGNDLTANHNNFVLTGGIFNYTASGPLTINGGTTNQSGGTLICSGSGIFANSNSNINMSGGTASFAATLFLNDNVTVNLSGQPNISLNGGLTILSSNNVNINFAFGSSSLPKINIPNNDVDFSNLAVNITNNSNAYIVPGTYTFLNVGGTITVGTVTLPSNNQFVQYSLGGVATNSGQEAFVRVVRTPLNILATNVYAQSMAKFFDQVVKSAAANNPNSPFLVALTNLQNSGVKNIDKNLFELSPQIVSVFPTLATVDMLLQQIDTRILTRRRPKYYAAGDELSTGDFWLSPFGNHAHQSAEGYLPGYAANSAGITMGIERSLSSKNILGLAGSYSNGRVKPVENSSSHTTMQAYQLSGYGTYSLLDYRYLDWIVAYNMGTNYSSRNIGLVNAIATAKYTTNSYAAKFIFSEDISATKNIIASPEVSAQYVNLHQNGYKENGASSLNYNVSAINTSLLRFGIGGHLTFLQYTKRGNLIPQLYGAVTYDVIRAHQNISANFVNSAPIFSIKATTPRLGGLAGCKAIYRINDDLNIVFDLNLQFKRHYLDTYGDLRLKYYF